MDSDQYDEVEAAIQADRDAARGEGLFAPTYGSTEADLEAAAQKQAEDFVLQLQRGYIPPDEDYGFGVGELIDIKPRLFFWEDLDGESSYISIANVTVVNVRGDMLIVKCGDLEAWTEDKDTIARFWAEWEVV